MWVRALVLFVIGTALLLLGLHTLWTRGAHLERVSLWLRYPMVRTVVGVIAGLWGMGMGLSLIWLAVLEVTR